MPNKPSTTSQETTGLYYSRTKRKEEPKLEFAANKPSKRAAPILLSNKANLAAALPYIQLFPHAANKARRTAQETSGYYYSRTKPKEELELHSSYVIMLPFWERYSVASCFLPASRTELRSLGWGWGSSAEKKGGWARLLQSASCRRSSHCYTIPMLKQRNSGLVF